MAICWRCGGGKTITMTTTGTHVLPCPTCGGSGDSVLPGEDVKHKDSATVKPAALDLLRTGPRVAS